MRLPRSGPRPPGHRHRGAERRREARESPEGRAEGKFAEEEPPLGSDRPAAEPPRREGDGVFWGVSDFGEAASIQPPWYRGGRRAGGVQRDGRGGSPPYSRDESNTHPGSPAVLQGQVCGPTAQLFLPSRLGSFSSQKQDPRSARCKGTPSPAVSILCLFVSQTYFANAVRRQRNGSTAFAGQVSSHPALKKTQSFINSKDQQGI